MIHHENEQLFKQLVHINSHEIDITNVSTWFWITAFQWNSDYQWHHSSIEMQLITASAQFVILCCHCMRMCVRCQKKSVYVLRHCENVDVLLLFHRAQLSHRLIESHFADSNGYTVANIQWVYGYSLKFIPCLIFATTVTVSANRGAGSYLISI